LGVFAKKPAPISVTWLGFGYTTGLNAIDYFLTDKVIVPEKMEEYFSEKPWRMNCTPFVYLPSENMGKVGELPALKNGFVTFGTLTRPIRLNSRVIRVWSRLLKQVPNARLRIDQKLFQDSEVCNMFKSKFEMEGISSDRLIMGFESPPWDVYRSIDITLDCFPHNCGTTLIESLYMGIPFVTLLDRPGMGRIGGSILNTLGFLDWVANDEAAYIKKAAELSSNFEVLAKIRKSLRGKIENSSLMNAKTFVKELEANYLKMMAVELTQSVPHSI
jgi:predicted O-linked N-acetylglucosamine transferase (SPINDLY family)